MFKKKYPIKKEFFPFSHFTPSLNPKMLKLFQKGMREPKCFRSDPDLQVETVKIPGWNGEEIEIYTIVPKGLPTPMPCLVNIHGGGFVFEGASHHYRLAMEYARQAGCMTVYVRYRLAPEYSFPTQQEDCFAALCWVYDHADALGIDRERIGVCGDSAGGTLTVTSCMMARDRGAAVQPLFQLLVYPWLDGRNCSDSYRRFTDTPMWNSTLSKKVGPLLLQKAGRFPKEYASPVEADTLEGMPPAYVEVAEFDCLHDDGVLYARLLKACGIEAELHETQGTMHGFDSVIKAPTTQQMIACRVAYMKKKFFG